MSRHRRARSILVAAVLALPLPVLAEEVVASGEFTGASGHITTGSVHVVRAGEGYVVKLGPDFSLDGAPDPKVGFGRDGVFEEGSLVGALKALEGEQDYQADDVEIGEINEVYIWCEEFSVPLGVARVD